MTTAMQTYRCASIDIGVINLAFCVTEFVSRTDGSFDFDLLHAQRVKIGNTRETIRDLGRKLLSFLSASDALRQDKLDYVFIEQQLSRAVKNIVLSYITMAYFETKRIGCGDSTKIVFVSPKNKFAAVRYAFPKGVLSSINFERRGRELKKLTVEVARLLFTAFGVKVGLDAMATNGTKLDDVSDAFLQSFAFFLEKFPSNLAARGVGSSFIRVEENRESKDADEQA
ncbi:unnamed protein product [Ectocarpus sp. 6 AP-2014]